MTTLKRELVAPSLGWKISEARIDSFNDESQAGSTSAATFSTETRTNPLLVVLILVASLILFKRGLRLKSTGDPLLLPREERTVNRLPNHLIENVASRNWSSVESWIAAHPNQLQWPDHRSQTLLHRICLVRAPASVVSLLLKHAPELAGKPNRDGELALHWAIRLMAPNEIVSLLLAAHPPGLTALDKEGQSPLSIVWERHREHFVYCYGQNPDSLQSLPSWTRLMHLFRLCGSSDPSTRKKGESNARFHPLHIAAMYPSPPDFFAFLTRAFPRELSVRDRNGDLPLHVACAIPRFGNRTCDHEKSIIQHLLGMYPRAALAVNAQGQLPFHLALRAGISWNEGLSDLFERYPEVIGVYDPVSGLYPFMLAAAAVRGEESSSGGGGEENDCKGLFTVFRLLRADPALLPPALSPIESTRATPYTVQQQ
jgi:ankyrin repeat protein